MIGEKELNHSLDKIVLPPRFPQVRHIVAAARLHLTNRKSILDNFE
jgi:hypothetical protein